MEDIVFCDICNGSIAQNENYSVVRGKKICAECSQRMSAGTNPPQVAPRVQAFAPVKKVSKLFYMGSCIGGPVAGVFLIIPGFLLLASERGAEALAVFLIVVGYAALLYGSIVGVVLLYKMWVAVPVRWARTTPGRAVGFLFIPFFNIYWIFQAYWGWTKDYNRFVSESRIRAPRMPEGLALAACILSLIPYAGIVSPILFLVLFFKACDGINALAEVRTEPEPIPELYR